ncbi:hypothetical protein SC206_04675 [Rouxiella sp. T17]|uniref:hypothetical protein n=1 Tax=Rouxiella sp. T17 TaxID=3085684 RepID=UPI002FCAD536
MEITLDMMVHGIALYESPEEFYQYVKIELEKQKKSGTYREITMENVVKKTSMAIDFFVKDRVVEKAVAETSKSRAKVEEILDKIGAYTLNQ